MSDKLNTSGTQRDVRADRLSIDPLYQRDRNEQKIKRIVNEFDPDAIGALYVSKRKDGTQVILDGQQRWAAIIEMGYADQLLPCVVYEGLTVADEADLFVKYNEVRTKPRPLDIYRAELAAGHKRAKNINAILLAHGLKVGTSIGTVQCIGAIQLIHDQASPQVLSRVFDVVLKAYPDDADAFQGEFLKALGVIIGRFGRKLDYKRLITVLARMDPLALLRAARRIRCDIEDAGAGVHGTLTTYVAQQIVRKYNTRLSHDKQLHFEMAVNTRSYWSPVK